MEKESKPQEVDRVLAARGGKDSRQGAAFWRNRSVMGREGILDTALLVVTGEKPWDYPHHIIGIVAVPSML